MHDLTGYLHTNHSITRLILRGETETASALINHIEGDDYSALIDLLSDIPTLPTNISVSYQTSNWATEWRLWHHKVEAAWNRYIQAEESSDHDDDDDSYSRVMNILMGNKQAIRQAGTFADSCMATLLYTDPTEHGYDMATVANQVYDAFRDNDALSISMYFLFTGDYDALLGSLSNTLWMQVHFGHLLLTMGFIPSDNDDERQNAEEEKITEPIYYSLNLYAMELVQKYGMWTEAIECIMVCRPNTNVWIKKVMSHSNG